MAKLEHRQGIVQILYYKSFKEFLEAGKQRLSGCSKWCVLAGRCTRALDDTQRSNCNPLVEFKAPNGHQQEYNRKT